VLRFLGAIKVILIDERYALTFRTNDHTLQIRTRPIACPDAAVRSSIAAIPCDATDFGEVSLHVDEEGVSMLVTLDITTQAIYREEMQLMRSQVELQLARVRRLIESQSQASPDGDA
jgi:hypothetical protein